jgi:hypothetical protein
MIGKMLDARLRRLEARAVATGPKPAFWLEAKDENGNWTDGNAGRWVAGCGVYRNATRPVYTDADLPRLAKTFRLILVCGQKAVTHDD